MKVTNFLIYFLIQKVTFPKNNQLIVSIDIGGKTTNTTRNIICLSFKFHKNSSPLITHILESYTNNENIKNSNTKKIIDKSLLNLKRKLFIIYTPYYTIYTSMVNS